MASVERTAYPRFKRTITSRELHEAFTPGPSEVAWARGKARSPEHLLALDESFRIRSVVVGGQ